MLNDVTMEHLYESKKIMFIIHAFICNESKYIFYSKLAIYHRYINNIEEDKIPTSRG